jgi:zinc protease
MKNLKRLRLALLAAASFLAFTSISAQTQSQNRGNPAQQAKDKNQPAASGPKLVAEMPPPSPPRPFTYPAPVSRTLSNGLRVFVISASALRGGVVDPAISVEMLIRNAGSVRDPQNKPGLAQMTGDLLRQGTDKRTSQDIASAIDFVGGTLTAGAGRDSTTLRVSVVKKDMDLGMDLLSDITLHAKFAPEEIARRQQRILSGFRVDYTDAGYLAESVFRRAIFGLTPYGTPPDGTPDSMRTITRDDLVAFRDNYYLPNETVMAFAGDLTPEEAYAAAEKYFGTWAKKDSAQPQVNPPAASSGVHLVVVNNPNLVQTEIRVGRLAIPRNNPDFIPLTVTNQIFGGGINSRLSTAIRVKRGLTYGAESGFAAGLYSGNFIAITSTRTEATVDATKLMLEEIGRMSSGEVTGDELSTAKDFLTGVFVIGSETPNQIAGRVTQTAFYGLPDDYNQKYPSAIRAVTAEQVKQVAAKYFDAANQDVVLVGNAATFRDSLRAAFPNARYDEIAADQVDLMAPDLRKAAQSSAPGNRTTTPSSGGGNFSETNR